MQDICSSDPPVVTGICDPNKSQTRHHHGLKLGLKLKYHSISGVNWQNISVRLLKPSISVYIE